MRMPLPLRLALLVTMATAFSACDPIGSPTPPSSENQGNTPLRGDAPMPTGRTLPDGARAVAPTETGEGLTAFTRLPDAGAPVDDEHLSGSAAYRVTVPGDGDRVAPLILAIPVDVAALPADWQASGLLTEVRGTSGWESVATMGQYDAERKLFWCRILPPPHPVLPVADEAGDVAEAGYRVTQASSAWTLEIRLAYLLSDRQTVRREGSHFRIHYYSSRVGRKYTLPRDADWTGSINAQDAAVPDFVEDLDAALEESYTALLAMKRTDGTIFSAPSLPIDVTVTDTGGDAGNSPLGGPIEIGARALTDYDDMRSVAAHELVHLLQGQHYSLYGLVSGRLNTWFIEASANHLAAKALAMTPEQRRAYYGDAMTSYLSVPLNTADAGSMYAAGHFLDYLVSRTDGLLVGDILAGRSRNDLAGISQALRNRGISGGVGTLLSDYVQAVVRSPQGTAGFHQDIKSKMEGYALGEGHLTGSVFLKAAAYRRIQRTLPPLATFYSGFVSRYSNPGMLVVRSKASQGALLKSIAYDVVGASDAAYTDRLAIDRYDQVPASRPWLFRNYGKTNTTTGAEWAVTNTSESSTATLKMDAYVLPYTFSSKSASGELTWETATAASIPQELLLGWRVFDGYKELTTKVLPLVGGVTQRFSHPDIETVGTYAIALEDSDGIMWPENNQFIELTPANPNTVPTGQSASVTARVIGRDDQAVTWEVEPEDPKRPGAWTISGNRITYSPGNPQHDECLGAKLTASSLETPVLSRSTYVSTCSDIWIDYCVSGDTPITLATGAVRPIARVQVGDQVLALAEDGQSLLPAVVEKVLVHADQPFVFHKLETRDGHTLRITGNHPVRVEGRGWVPAEDLKPGDLLFIYDPAVGRLVKSPLLSLVREQGKAGTVYNLKTSRASYLANGVMVHNKCLAAGSLIDTPAGPRVVEAIAVGDMVWGRRESHRVATRVTHVYRKEVALATLPGRVVAPGVRVTDNHPIEVAGRFMPAGRAGLPATTIAGPIYDLRTESGNYFAGGTLMATGDE